MPDTRLTALIHRMQAGDRDAAGRVYRAIADRLRQMSAAIIRREHNANAMRASDLVQDLYLKVGGLHNQPPVQGQTHFFGLLGRSMKQILIDHGRKRGTLKRREAPLGHQPPMSSEEQLNWSLLLQRLHAVDPEGARILSLHHEEGLSREQIAERLGITAARVRDKEAIAVEWLRRRQRPARATRR